MCHSCKAHLTVITLQFNLELHLEGVSKRYRKVTQGFGACIKTRWEFYRICHTNRKLRGQMSISKLVYGFISFNRD